MKGFRVFSIFAAAITVLSGTALATKPMPPVPAEFAAKIVEAYNSHNLDNFIPLFHPDYAKCITPENKDKFAYGIWWGRKADHISEGYKTSEEPVDPRMKDVNDETKNPYAKFQTYPAIPDVNLRIDYSPREGASVSKLFPIKWETTANPYIVFGCPTQAGLEEFDKKMKAIAEHKEKVLKLWGALDEKTQTQTKESVKAGKLVDAQQSLIDKHNFTEADANAIARMIEDGEL